MIRRIFTFASTLSLVLLATSLCLWPDSYFGSVVVYHHSPHHRVGFTTYNGQLHLAWVNLRSFANQPAFNPLAVNPLWPNRFFEGPIFLCGLPIPTYFEVTWGPNGYEMGLQWWFLTLAFAILPLWRWRTSRRERRRKGGRCLACGYDLTGNTSGRCPECGAAIPATAQ